MPSPFYNTSGRLGLRKLEGTSKVHDIGTGFQALGADIEAIAVASVTPSVITTEQSRENTAYGTLTTPDEVTVVLPENGLIAVAYQATWRQSVSKAARAALFLGANQLRLGGAGSTEAFLQEAEGGTSKAFSPLSTTPIGLVGTNNEGEAEYGGDVTTGQVVGGGRIPTGPAEADHNVISGGPCYVFAAAGTYKISVQFKASSGKVTVKNRKLWAWVVA